MNASPISILIIENHPSTRAALRTSLEAEPDLKVIAEAYTGEEGLVMFVKYRPNLVLIDLWLSGIDGLRVISKIISIDPRARILVITDQEDPSDILAAIQDGALGYFPISVSLPYLLEAVRKVANGVPYLPAGIALKLFREIRQAKAHAD